jgi:hypothetical protein
MATRKQFKNQGDDSLAATLLSGSLTMTVNDGAKFPTVGDYHLVLSSASTYEVVVCTSRATNVLTITRAAEGTTAVEHPSGTRVTLTLTPESFRRYVADEVEMVHNNIALCDYGIFDERKNRLTSADFTWVNQGTATVEDYEDGSICLEAFGNVAAHNNRILEMDMPTAPFVVRAVCIPQLHNDNDSIKPLSMIGMCIRDSVGGRLWTNSIGMFDGAAIRDRLLVADYSATTTFSSFLTNFDGAAGRNFHVFEIEYAANENVTFRSSPNGYWWQIFNHDSSAYAMDKIGFFAMPGNAAAAGNNFHTINTLVSWEVRLL